MPRSGSDSGADQSLHVESGRAEFPERVRKDRPFESPRQLRRPHRATVEESCTGDSNQPEAVVEEPSFRTLARLPVAARTPPGASRSRVASPSLVCAMSALLLAITSWADDKEKDEDRLKNASTVLTEILNLPDNIPQDLLDKADCVVVFPSVLKAAFVVGGSYGRGAMTCRKGENFNGPWGAPSMMALEGGSVGFQIKAGKRLTSSFS